MKLSKFISAIALILFSFLLVASVSAKQPHQNESGTDPYNGWTEIDPLEVYPDFSYNGLKPSCANCPPTLDTTTGMPKYYDPQFTFFANLKSDKNLVVYFQGGGACWDSLNCLYVHTFYEEVPPLERFTQLEGQGIFDPNNPENPFKDWSVVYIPYCTGDVHWGANDKEYEAIDAYSGLVAEQEDSFTIKHRGFVNFQVVLKWIQDNFQKPQKIFVTGSSAGSYGAIMGFPYIKETYPNAHVSILGDAGNGVVSEGFQTESLANWGIQENLPDWIPGFDRPFTDFTIADMYKMNAEYYPHSKLGQYTAAWDWNQTFFYAVMLDIDKFPRTNPSVWQDESFWSQSWESWHNQMLDFAYEAAEAPNYRYYVGPGTSHTIMMSPLFYTDISSGIYFTEWLEAMVGNQGGTNGHGAMPWVNVECIDCEFPMMNQ